MYLASTHPAAPEALRIAAGDGFFESDDGGLTWASPMDGLEVGYLRSVAIDPGNSEVVVISASSGPRSAYLAGQSGGRLYRRARQGRWERVRDGWPDVPSTIAPLLTPGHRDGELWAVDERGVHRSSDGGVTWGVAAVFETTPRHRRALVVVQERGS